MEIKEMIAYLHGIAGREIKIMEVCGTHTASIFKSGIRSLMSPNIHLISGPGCPVCVTPSAYIDRCIAYAKKENHILCTFGDMMKVPGELGSLTEAKGEGAHVELMYSPLEVIEKAAAHPDQTYVIAAVGFETTAAAYALAMEEILQRGLQNIKFVTALKTVMPALYWICAHEEGIDAFICPGHVSVIIGSQAYEALAADSEKPYVVAGFEPEHIVAAVYNLVRRVTSPAQNKGEVHNLYGQAVKPEGNQKAQALIAKYFTEGPAVWRGLGEISESGLYLKEEYGQYDGGSRGLDQDLELPAGCRCGEVIVGRIAPNACPMFGSSCHPSTPYGPCMVSSEGACGIWYRNR